MPIASPRARVTSNAAAPNSRPPVFDLGLFLAAGARSLPLAITVGLVVGVLVGLVASGARSEYSVTTTVSVGTPSRAERDAATMDALAAGMSEYVTGQRARYYIEENSGEKVSLKGLRPSVEITTSKIPGVLEIVTRSHSGALAAAKMGELAVEAMNLRSTEAREEVLKPVAETAQKEIDQLNEQIQARRRLDDTADTSDLLQLIYEARSTTEKMRAAYPTASIIAQDDAGGEPTWPKPLSTGLLAGISTALLTALVVGSLRLRRSHRTDAIWARSMGHRHGAVVDIDMASPRALPPITEAAVSAVLSAGGTVVVLGSMELVEPPLGSGSEKLQLVVVPHDELWWRDLPASEVDLGVVVVDQGSREGEVAEAGLASLAEVGVPVRLALRLPETIS